MAMNPENSRYDRSAVPESSWPDGTPVSNWSKAVAAFGLASRHASVGEQDAWSRDAPLLARAG
jgi:hypothetical protein